MTAAIINMVYGWPGSKNMNIQVGNLSTRLLNLKNGKESEKIDIYFWPVQVKHKIFGTPFVQLSSFASMSHFSL